MDSSDGQTIGNHGQWAMADNSDRWTIRDDRQWLMTDNGECQIIMVNET